ncbi:hypothetical protein NEOKW01_1196 [Nematocida sp. AWRm80]|nr:hypothetical protein NEOKW01_1196 [Nematocida sp. AWRm80]
MLYALNGYTFSKCIGEGAYAEVFLSKDTQQNSYAIKVVHKGRGRKRGTTHARKEIKALTHLSKIPGIPLLKEWSEDETDFYLVLEYFEGYTADTLPTHLQTEEILILSLSILEILKRMHQEGVYHLDIKPSNVILSKTGVHLIDFGCSVLSSQGSVDLSTLPFDGTPAFMAPEMIKRTPKHQIELEKVDIWSFGCLLYFLATQKEPFNSTSLYSLYPKILKCDVNYSKVPDSITRILQSIFVSHPDNRSSLQSILKQVITELTSTPLGTQMYSEYSSLR